MGPREAGDPDYGAAGSDPDQCGTRSPGHQTLAETRGCGSISQLWTLCFMSPTLRDMTPHRLKI